MTQQGAADSASDLAGRTDVVREGLVAQVVFDHQKRRNAMTLDMWSQLGEACTNLEAEDLTETGARVVVFRGAGDDAFVAGADISQFTEARPSGGGQSHYNQIVNECYEAVAALPQPTVAAVKGFCIGGGVGIAVSCDLRIADSSARFGVPPARLGIGYPADGVAALVRLIGPAWTKQLIYTGDLIDAATALRIGLVNEVVSPEDLDSRVLELAATMVKRSPFSQRAAKVSVAAAFDSTLLPEAAAWVDRCSNSADYEEGVAAFMEKRAPRFSGR